MDVTIAAMLGLAGLAGGTLSSLVGGASLITFPALLAAGLPPLTAVTSNMAALAPGNFLAALADRSQLPQFDRAFIGLVLASIAGAAAGAALLLLTPARLFAVLVPVLLGFATVLFACGGTISRWIRKRALARHGREPALRITSLPMLLPVSVYGGYFGAGVGVLLIAVLSIASAGDYRAANVAKNLVTSLNTATAAVIFALQGSVSWPAALAMMTGVVAGGLVGARIARSAPQALMRALVIAVGVLLTAIYAWRYWF